GVGWPVMDDDQVLVVVSAAQLATGVGGLALALRRRHAFDIAFWHGQPSAVGRDAVLMGTALSAPAVMLGAQAGAITALLRWPSPAAPRVLGGLRSRPSAAGQAPPRGGCWAGWAPRWWAGTWPSGWYGTGSPPPAGIWRN